METRYDDPPEKRVPRWKYVVAVWVARNQLAVLAALVLIPVGILSIMGWTKIDSQTTEIQRAQKQIVELNRRQLAQRKATTRVFCNASNDQAHSVNVLNDAIQALIVKGAKGSIIFEALFKQYGAPTYTVRLKMAKKDATDLNALKLTRLTCDDYTDQIQRLMPKTP